MPILEKKNQPKLDLPNTPLDILLDLAIVFGCAAIIALLIIKYPALPDRVPTGFDAAGQIRDWGGKSFLLIMPLTGLLTGIMLLVLARFPHTYNFMTKITPENAAAQYKLARLLVRWIGVSTTGLMLYLEWISIQAAFGVIYDSTGIVTGIGVGAIMVPTIAYMFASMRAK